MSKLVDAGGGGVRGGVERAVVGGGRLVYLNICCHNKLTISLSESVGLGAFISEELRTMHGEI